MIQPLLPSRKEEPELSLYRGQREEIEVKADTLSAVLSANRAILFQKEGAPLTRRDTGLRETILDLYPHSRPTPFP